MQQCAQMNQHTFTVHGYTQTGMFSEHMQPHCTCPAYKFSKGEKTCKHIAQVYEQTCNWHQNYSDEVQTEEQNAQHKCPRCGGETVVVRVAV
jgi:predicted RNA-binding Zn-ribbon protein involved in translation (DUF1610 family)